MTAPGAWGALPPEENSAGFWLGPGAESFFAAAENMLAAASGLIANLGGHEAVNAALAAAWPDPTGALAILSKVPLMLWQAMAAGQMTEASAAIHATGLAFETLKAATPTPLEIGENQIEHGVLQANNFFGMLTPAIGVNRANYGRMWVTAASNKYEYAAASAAGIQSIPPIPPPPPATAGAASTPSMPTPSNKTEDLASSPEQALQAFMGPLQQVGSMGSQFGSGGPLSSLGQMGQSAFGPLTQMLQSGGMGGNTDALASSMSADWLSATPGAGGPVAANLVSGLGGGGGGGGSLGGLSALRGPTGFASAPTINAATANPEATVSRVSEARMATGAPASTAGMGGSGAMMGPMAGHQDNKQEAGKERRSTPLASLASLYRAPATVPVITGGGGAVFRGEEGNPSRET